MASYTTSLGSGRKGGVAFSLVPEPYDRLQRALNGIDKTLRKPFSKELRKAAKEIASKHLIPEIKHYAAATPHATFAKRMADTARAKSDRWVVVQIGGVNPKLSGFKRGVGAKKAGGTPSNTKLKGGRLATSQNYRTTLAWGSERGPYPGTQRNVYGVPRKKSYYVLKAVQEVGPDAQGEYNQVLDELFDKYRVSPAYARYSGSGVLP